MTQYECDNEKIKLLDYLITVASKEGSEVWRALFAEIRNTLACPTCGRRRKEEQKERDYEREQREQEQNKPLDSHTS